jgi:hypothetical protein
MQSLESTYPKAWRDLWRKRVMHWTSWLAWAVFVLVAHRLSLDLHSWVFMSVAGVLAIFTSFTYVGLQAFACPRCHQRFFFIVASLPLFLQNKCFHCGLSKYDA